MVDTARVGGERGAVWGGQVGIGFFGDPAHALLAHLPIAFEQAGDNLRQRPAGESAQRVHLPQPVLRGDISL